MSHENIKGSLKKGNYGDLLSTLERDFMNNNLDKIIERKPIRRAGPKPYQKKPKNNRFSRGLKVLSVKVRDIVFQKKQTTYKEVAEALISENNKNNHYAPGLSKKTKNKKRAKEEQNVKRRVYDALNVLIAAEVLRKTNKIVYFNESVEKGVGRNFQKEKNDLNQKLHQKELGLMRKKLDLQTLIQKFIAIMGLMKRNKANNVTSHVKFPFLLIAPAPGNDTEVTLEMQPNYKKLLLQSNKEITLNGDLEVLILLNMHFTIGQNNFNEIMGKYFEDIKGDLLSILDPEYLQIVSKGIGSSS